VLGSALDALLEACGAGLAAEALGEGLGLEEARGAGLVVESRGRGLADGGRLGVGEDLPRTVAASAVVVPSWLPEAVTALAVAAGRVVHSAASRKVRCGPDKAPEPVVTTASTTKTPSAAVWVRPRSSSTRSRSAHRGRRRACFARFVRSLMTRSPFPPVPIRHLMPPTTLSP
jgi:hypothetical protein